MFLVYLTSLLPFEVATFELLASLDPLIISVLSIELYVPTLIIYSFISTLFLNSNVNFFDWEVTYGLWDDHTLPIGSNFHGTIITTSMLIVLEFPIKKRSTMLWDFIVIFKQWIRRLLVLSTLFKITLVNRWKYVFKNR